LGFDVPEIGNYTINTQFTKAIDYGIVQVYLNGHKIGSPLDFFNADVMPFQTVISEAMELNKGRNRIKFEIVGSNDLAIKSYMVGLDYLVLTKND